MPVQYVLWPFVCLSVCLPQVIQPLQTFSKATFDKISTEIVRRAVPLR